MQSVDAAVRRVEARAVALIRVREDGAPVVAAADAAFRVGARAAKLAVLTDGDVATGRGVDGHLVVGLRVDAFDYVDLAVLGPGGACQPAGAVGVSRQNCVLYSEWVEMSERSGKTYYAGQEPQALPGMCAKSAMNRPSL